MTNAEPEFLNRFTTIPFLIDLLTKKRLTLINPSLWEDFNDRVTMELYCRKKNSQAIYALCLTHKRETIHHWNAFAAGTNGCCLEFDAKKLFQHLKTVEGVIHGESQYVKIKDLSKLKKDIEILPYLKREPFRPESEYRIIALSNNPQLSTFDIPIEINLIRKITISNKLHDDVFKSLKSSLKLISPDFRGRISHSTLFKNSVWVNHFTKQS